MKIDLLLPLPTLPAADPMAQDEWGVERSRPSFSSAFPRFSRSWALFSFTAPTWPILGGFAVKIDLLLPLPTLPAADPLPRKVRGGPMI